MPQLRRHRAAVRSTDDRVVRDKAAMRVQLCARAEANEKTFFVGAEQQDPVVGLSDIHVEIITSPRDSDNPSSPPLYGFCKVGSVSLRPRAERGGSNLSSDIREIASSQKTLLAMTRCVLGLSRDFAKALPSP